jgi:hypothetical protein
MSEQEAWNIKTGWLAYNEPLDKDCKYNSIVLVRAIDAIEYLKQRASRMKRNYTDREALNDFMAVNYAWKVHDVPFEEERE